MELERDINEFSEYYTTNYNGLAIDVEKLKDECASIAQKFYHASSVKTEVYNELLAMKHERNRCASRIMVNTKINDPKATSAYIDACITLDENIYSLDKKINKLEIMYSKSISLETAMQIKNKQLSNIIQFVVSTAVADKYESLRNK